MLDGYMTQWEEQLLPAHRTDGISMVDSEDILCQHLVRRGIQRRSASHPYASCASEPTVSRCELISSHHGAHRSSAQGCYGPLDRCRALVVGAEVEVKL